MTNPILFVNASKIASAIVALQIEELCEKLKQLTLDEPMEVDP